MIWFFHRGTAELRLEAKFDSRVGDYIAELYYPDGTHHAERFSDEELFRVYLADLERPSHANGGDAMDGRSCCPTDAESPPRDHPL
jgi:hypothetical protein